MFEGIPDFEQFVVLLLEALVDLALPTQPEVSEICME